MCGTVCRDMTPLPHPSVTVTRLRWNKILEKAPCGNLPAASMDSKHSSRLSSDSYLLGLKERELGCGFCFHSDFLLPSTASQSCLVLVGVVDSSDRTI